MLLEARDRLRFLEYCTQQSCSCRSMAEQMEKIPGMIPQAIQREKQKAAAFAIVAMELASVEEFSVSGEDVGNVSV